MQPRQECCRCILHHSRSLSSAVAAHHGRQANVGRAAVDEAVASLQCHGCASTAAASSSRHTAIAARLLLHAAGCDEHRGAAAVQRSQRGSARSVASEPASTVAPPPGSAAVDHLAARMASLRAGALLAADAAAFLLTNSPAAVCNVAGKQQKATQSNTPLCCNLINRTVQFVSSQLAWCGRRSVLHAWS
jgi:hypothetical protein